MCTLVCLLLSAPLCTCVCPLLCMCCAVDPAPSFCPGSRMGCGFLLRSLGLSVGTLGTELFRVMVGCSSQPAPSKRTADSLSPHLCPEVGAADVTSPHHHESSRPPTVPWRPGHLVAASALSVPLKGSVSLCGLHLPSTTLCRRLLCAWLGLGRHSPPGGHMGPSHSWDIPCACASWSWPQAG